MKTRAKIIITDAWQNTVHGQDLPLITRLSFLFTLIAVLTLIPVFLLSPLWVALSFFMDSFLSQFLTLVIFGPFAIAECYFIYFFIRLKRLKPASQTIDIEKTL